MKGPRKSRLDDDASEINLRLGDLLGQLGQALVEAAQRLDSGDSGEIRREFGAGRGPVRASAGIRISTLGADARAPQTNDTQTTKERRPDKPTNMSPDKLSAAQRGPTVRRLEATVFDEPDNWSLVAEMPGIDQNDVTLTARDSILRIEAVTPARHYILETTQPDGWTRFDCTLTNGILEVRALPEENRP